MELKRGICLITIILFIVAKSQSQSSAKLWLQKWESYQAAYPKTKLHLVINQDTFSPGDTAYFKAYYLKQDLTPVSGKQLVDLHLIDTAGQSKFHLVFSATNGIGHNQLFIPSALPSGSYRIIAYSNWMKNFDPSSFFSKEVTIVKKNRIEKEERLPIRIVAEGGHLVRDIANKLSMVTAHPSSTVQLVDASGKEINRISTDKNGVGSMLFTPAGELSYYARLIDDPEKRLIPIPATEQDGITVRLSSFDNLQPIKVIIASPPGSAIRNEELTIIVVAREKVYFTATVVQGDQDFVEAILPIENWPAGIAHLSVHNQTGVLRASRDFYYTKVANANVQLTSAKNSFRAREKVRFEVMVTDNNGQPLKGEFSIKVNSTALVDSEAHNSLSDELIIFSGINERYRIDRSDKNWLTSLDNFLIANTKAIPFNEIAAKPSKPKFSNIGYLQKRGMAYLGESGKPVPDLTQILFYAQRSNKRYQVTVDKGKFWLPIPDLQGQEELFYLAESFYYVGGKQHGNEISNLKIVWEEDELIQLPRSSKVRETDSLDHYASFIEKSRLIDRAFGAHVTQTPVPVDQNARTNFTTFETKIAKADVTINVEDYSLFSTMGEFVKEVIPALYFRQSGKKAIVRVVLSPVMSELATGDPLYVIDGIATKNTDYFVSLKPADLVSVKIVFTPIKLLSLGLLGKNGIVIVQTKKGNVTSIPENTILPIEGVAVPIRFPTYDPLNTTHHTKPYFRSTIYWNPSIETDETGKASVEFFCSDDVGKLTIRLDGLSTSGRPFSKEHQIEVSNELEKK